jgi:fumarate reductase flavoprotein subunit
MGPAAARNGWSEPDAEVLEACLAHARSPFEPGTDAPADALDTLRERLYATMWEDAGIVRDAAGLARASGALDELRALLLRYRLPAGARDPTFNVAWHDWLNLVNLVEVSRVIVAAAMSREDSRGAHFRADHPRPGDPAASTFTRARRAGDAARVEHVPVRFTRVAPGNSLLP